MGKGIAVQFKSLWPEMFDSYQKLCKTGHLKPGGLMPWADCTRCPKGAITVYNLAVKDHWNQPAQLQWVVDSVRQMMSHAHLAGTTVIAMPQIGCGLGGLSWNEVLPHLIEICNDTSIHVRICAQYIKGAALTPI